MNRFAAGLFLRTLRMSTPATVLCVLFLGWAHAARADGAPFTKITTGDLVTIPAFYWNGSWGDYDDDGYLDLFVGSASPSVTNYLYHNNQNGTFTLVDAAKMPRIQSNQHGSTWGDYDNDGHLDLIVTAGEPGLGNHNVLYNNNGDGTFTPVTAGPIYTFTQSAGFHAPSFLDYDNDGFIDLFIAGHAIRNVLFHNHGDGTFTQILSSDPDVGVLVSDDGASEGRSWVDYDNDGHIDFFVSNPAPYKNFLYRNDGHGVFAGVTNSGLTDRVEDTVGACWADYDNDGFLDVFLANAQQNSLYHNNGDGTFTAVTDSAVVQDVIPSNSIFSGCAWGDYDNDGFIDLFVTQGGCLYPPSAECLHTPRANNFLYHNNGDGTFTKVTQGSVVNDLVTQCPGASWGDYDRDGFLDLFVSQGAAAADAQANLLYHNDGNGNAWLNVKLVGTVSNRSAIGAKVRVKAFYGGQSRWQVRQIISGDSESNQSNALNAVFGLADATSIDTLRVEWPSGIVQELHGVAPRQFLTITEPHCAGALPDCRTAGKSLLSIKRGSNPDRDTLKWRWRQGQATSFDDFGTPTGTTAYTLCVYSGTSSALAYTAPGGANWEAIGTKGFRYRDRTGTSDGIRRVVLKSGVDSEAEALVRGKVANLPDPTLPLELPVTAQLINNDTTTCMTTTFPTARKNTTTLFSARSP